MDRKDWLPTVLAFLPARPPAAGLFSFRYDGWTPLVPTEQAGVYSSLWEGDGCRLWTLVNRSREEVRGTLLRVEPGSGQQYFDLITGREVTAAAEGGVVALEGLIDPRGIGCFIAGTRAGLGEGFQEFLANQKDLRSRANLNSDFPFRDAKLTTVRATRLYGNAERPQEMAAIPAAAVELNVVFRVRECGFYESSSEYFAGSGFHRLHGARSFAYSCDLGPYAIDLTPVTNAQFARFLEASGYRPEHPENLLKHWKGGAYAPELAEHPVVYVDLDDARAYARWAGKRLPTEAEWQYAAQGSDGLLYPWENEMRPSRCNGGETGGTTPVKAFPDGRSPFGCYDMCGNTWEWTESERSDGRTRFAILRGGSYYTARGSDWYFDGGPVPTTLRQKCCSHGLDWIAAPPSASAVPWICSNLEAPDDFDRHLVQPHAVHSAQGQAEVDETRAFISPIPAGP